MKQKITWAFLLTKLGNGNGWIGLHIRRWPREYPERVREFLQLTPLVQGTNAQCKARAVSLRGVCP